ncbi:flagellar basal body L-ring protein FlgH [Shewanella profunda]|uniref:flagellar basal body L-ring protein FlgH n=1 Tax=Shewanella profunda TaxID=254793 RepID=UPI00200E7968|nr:flagellar basal body L-ring protein FlgH [Shewanella profunda]MCL1090377.1 flagellar basal body L-ring protein FlgH [Shewanella profunda]
MKSTTIYYLLLCLLLTACTTVEKQEIKSPTKEDTILQVLTKEAGPVRGEPEYRPVRDGNLSQVQPVTGSIFNASDMRDIYQNNSRYEIGDMILVRLNEKISSEKSLSYQRDKSDQFELSPDIKAGNIAINNDNLSADYKQEKSFDSSSASNHKNSLSGTITVSVREKLPNGNLIIAGEKWIKLNKGDEYVRFSGEVRVSDIAYDHSIDSILVGNSVIEVSGKGEQQDNQDTSLIGKLLNIFG